MFKIFNTHIFNYTRNSDNKYDIPLHSRMGTEFLVLLIAMMTYLLLLSAAGSISLGSLTNKWTSGLENTMTIEIPASSKAENNAKNLVKKLNEQEFVGSARILNDKDMQEILSPWLGDSALVFSDLPMPVLISIELKIRDDKVLITTQSITRRIAPDAIVDAHEDWLNSLLKLTSTLQWTAMVIFSLIVAVTALVIAGAVRSRMAIHQRELELLHIMGASDSYISGQFVRYILAQSTKGLLIGLGVGVLTLTIFATISYKSSPLIPDIGLIDKEWFILFAVPMVVLLVGTFTARHTAISVLRNMP